MNLTRPNLTGLAIAALACTAWSVPALAHEVIYTTMLSGAAEAPPNASPGTGFATLTVDNHDFTMRLQVSFSGLVGNVSAAHIHCCTSAAGAGTAGVATQTPSFLGFPHGGTSGSYDQTFDMTQLSSWNTAFVNAHGGTTGQAFDDLLTALDSGKAYLNIHTSSVPGGEIRGFLAVSAVPEPESWALMLGGLGLVAAWSRRRQQG